MNIDKNFFSRDAKKVARELLGKVIVRILNGKKFKAKIVETEAYYGEEDPASRASKGKNKISEMMWAAPGRILVYNVHRYKMFNIVTGKEDMASAVLIRALKPLNFKARLGGPGLLTEFLKIDKKFHGKDIFKLKEIFILNERDKNLVIKESYRIGVSKDLPEKLRFYIEDDECVSRK